MGMNMMDMIMQAAGGQAPQQMGQQFGLNQQQSQSAISALLPAISSAMKQNTNNPQGLAGLLGALEKGNHGQYLDNPSQLGIGADVLKKMLPIVAMMAMGSLGKQTNGAGMFNAGGGMKGMLAQMALQQVTGGSSRSGLGGMLGGLLGGGTARRQQAQAQQAHSQGLGMLGNMLDADGDGSSMDDVLGMLMKR